jgi:hypothetical protein
MYKLYVCVLYCIYSFFFINRLVIIIGKRVKKQKRFPSGRKSMDVNEHNTQHKINFVIHNLTCYIIKQLPLHVFSRGRMIVKSELDTESHLI